MTQAPRSRPVADSSNAPTMDKLGQGRLIVALDALLTKRNVTLAAKELGIQPSAMSRLLAQLREELGDELFIRSGHGMVPTPFAESLRARVRTVAQELENLFTPMARQPAAGSLRFDDRWNVPSPIEPPSLAYRPANLLEGEPSTQSINAKLDRIAKDAPSYLRLARNIGVLGVAGGGNGRPLTIDEAEEAMRIILSGDADPVQIGALLGMMRVRGSTAIELAGFVKAAREHVTERLKPGNLRADVDWPCYTSPNYHNPPWFFHAARLIARAGLRVVLHGNTGSGDTSGRYAVVADLLGIPVCASASDITRALDDGSIAYVPLAGIAPQIYRLLGLHRLMESRSIIFEAVHLLKPVEARTSLLGVAKSSYKELHRDTAAILGWKNIAVLNSTRDVAQFMPFRLSGIHRLINGETDDLIIPALMREPAATPRPRGTSLEYWQGVWTGATRDTRAEAVIVSTAAFALFSLSSEQHSHFSTAMDHAWELWRSRLNTPKSAKHPALGQIVHAGKVHG